MSNRITLTPQQRAAVNAERQRMVESQHRLTGMLNLIVAQADASDLPGGWMLAEDGASLVPAIALPAVEPLKGETA